MVANGVAMRGPAYFLVLAAIAAALFCGLAVAVSQTACLVSTKRSA